MLRPHGPTHHIAAVEDDHPGDIVYPATVPFLLVHLACLAAIGTGVTAEALVLCGALYLLRIFAIGAGYHRYFAHRAYKTSRVVQFLLAFLAQTSAQRGVLWWAAKHRRHHRHSDTELDVHSPRQHGFLYAHLGWIFTPRHGATDYDAIADFARYPELVWLDRHPYLPAGLFGLLAWLIAGWPGLVVGFCWSTVLLWHVTFAINSVAHVAGRVRYVTGDDSRNNWFLAFLTMGEGWHNNHHAYQSSVRQGFRWWEYDPTFYALKFLSWLGVVWDLQTPPETVIRGEQRLGRKVVEKVARQLAGEGGPPACGRISGRTDRRAGPRNLGSRADLGRVAVERPTGPGPRGGLPGRDPPPAHAKRGGDPRLRRAAPRLDGVPR